MGVDSLEVYLARQEIAELGPTPASPVASPAAVIHKHGLVLFDPGMIFELYIEWQVSLALHVKCSFP